MPIPTPPDRPRVLILVNALETDAPTRLMLEVARAAQASGRYECHLVSLSRGGPLQKEAKSGLAGVHNLELGPMGSLVRRSMLRDFITRLSPHLLHASLLRPTLLGIPAARAAAVPKVAVTCHGTHEWGEASPFPEWLIRRSYVRTVNRADAVVGVSGAVTQQLQKSGVHPSLCHTIWNGIDPQHFRPEFDDSKPPGSQPLDSIRHESGIIRIGAAGNLRPVKGFDILIEAITRLLPQLPDGRRLDVTIWGEGPEQVTLEQQIAARGLKKNVKLAGRCADMREAFRRCDIYVQPSRSESFGLAAAEAMACGVPVVAADAGGLPELIGTGEEAGGLLFPRESPEALAERLKGLIAAPDLRRCLGAQARNRVMAYFTLERMVASYLALYDSLCSRQGPAEP